MAFKKYIKKAKAYAKKRYVKKTAGKSILAVMKDVQRLKNVLNPEQKRFQLTYTNQKVGQCSVNAVGYWAVNITPQPAEGITGATRNGNSIKLANMKFKFQIKQMATTLTAIRFKYYIFGAKGQAFTSATIAAQALLDTNVFNALIDFNSDRNEDSRGQIKLIKQGKFYLRESSVATSTGSSVAAAITISDVHFTLPFKNYHVKFDSDTINPLSGSLYLVIVADCGNIGGTDSTLTTIPVAAANTGAYVSMDLTSHFYDN